MQGFGVMEYFKKIKLDIPWMNLDYNLESFQRKASVYPIHKHIATNEPADTPIHSFTAFIGTCFDNSINAPTCAIAHIPPPDKYILYGIISDSLFNYSF